MGMSKEAYLELVGQRDKKPPKTSRHKPPSCPSERDEQLVLAAYLNSRGLLWWHTPNGGYRSQRTAAQLKEEGVKAGVPDVLIFETTKTGRKGLAIELKRVKGGKRSRAQRACIDALGRAGWAARFCNGADEAIKLVEEMYPS